MHEDFVAAVRSLRKSPGCPGQRLTVLALAGLVASVVPARRAASVDPLIALRHE